VNFGIPDADMGMDGPASEYTNHGCIHEEQLHTPPSVYEE